MAIVWCRETAKDRGVSGKFQETSTYTRSFLVRTDNPDENIAAISNEPGIAMGDAHPIEPTCRAMEFDVKPVDDTGLLYTVTFKYYVPPPDGGDPQDPPTGSIDGFMKQPTWSGSSSVVTVPCFEYYENGNTQKKTIVNSANEPIEGLECEAAEFRLALTGYYVSHDGWMSDAADYTNAVNSDIWHYCGPGTWKCQGCSAQLQTVQVSGVSYIFWEVTWEFAYRDGGWNLKPWDVGFMERCGTDGVASASGDKRKTIMGQDKKAVKEPVALASGVALPAGSPPTVINNGFGVRVYREMPFGSKFGQVYTPTIPNT